jgi:hypothetical protein
LYIVIVNIFVREDVSVIIDVEVVIIFDGESVGDGFIANDVVSFKKVKEG